jgi:hypothetical protein
MSISSISSSVNSFQTNQANVFAQVKKDFDNLGSALESGNLSDAKKAFAQLQKDAPSQSGKDNNPMSSAIESLGKALDSGDIQGAQEIYKKIQGMMSQGPPAGGAEGAKGPPAGGSGDTKSSGSNINVISQSNSTVYDKRDTNKDGTVSAQEAIEYALKHPAVADNGQQILKSSNSKDNMVGNNLNAMA